MRTVIVVGIGLVVLTVMTWFRVTGWFIGLWLVFSIIDWYVGVYRAGYPAMEELRLHAIIFGLPAAIALLLILLGR